MRKPLCKMPGSRIELYPKSVDLQRPELIVEAAGCPNGFRKAAIRVYSLQG